MLRHWRRGKHIDSERLYLGTFGPVLWQKALGNRELDVRQHLDRLGDIDARFSLAMSSAEMEKELAKLLSLQIETVRYITPYGKAPKSTRASLLT